MQLFDKQSILFESCFPSGDLSRPIYYDWRRLSKPALRVSDRREISVLIAIFFKCTQQTCLRSRGLVFCVETIVSSQRLRDCGKNSRPSMEAIAISGVRMNAADIKDFFVVVLSAI
jgi:hypothetical protein